MFSDRRRQRLRRRRQRQRWLLLLVVLLVPVAVIWRWPQLALDAEFARQRWLAGANEHSVQVDDHRWRYLEAGEGPTVLLLHGFTGSKENWLPVMAQLAPRFRLIAPDLPGWGESERKAGGDYGFVSQSARLQRFIEQVIDDQGLHLVGHSMGGGIAALWAGTRPPALQRLVLLDAAGVPFDNDFARAVAAGEHPFEVLDEAGLRRQIALVFDQAPWIPWPAGRALVDQRSAQSGFERDVLKAIAGTPEQAYAPGEAARQINRPTLLLWCRNDRIIDISAAHDYAERIAGSVLVTLEQCNHMPMMERPEQTADVLREFLGVASAANR